jgi:PKD repeat protein
MTRLLSTWRGWLFAIFAAVLLTACDPIVDIIAPSEAEVGVPVVFSNERLPQFKDAEFSELQYDWDFGDGAKASGPQVTHTYAEPGDYEVVLSVSDASVRSWGQAYVSKKTIKVSAYTGALVPVSVRVYDDNGRTVQGATVSMGGQSAQTDRAGGALITPAQPTTQPVVVIRKAGYLAQSVRVPEGQPAERGVVVSLKKEAPAVAIEDIAAAQTVAPSDTNLSPIVALPPQAFVNAKGESVVGAASVRVTPWDITSESDMAAFPGDAKADDGTGRVVSLISFGMLSIEFEQGGEKLQLAPGKKAVISMHLPITHDVQGQVIKVGDVIPLWHFNEARGVWEREGEGVVEASEGSETGLAVRAEVGHFSSWNWDRVAGPEVFPVSRPIQCLIPHDSAGFKPLDDTDLCVVRIEQRRPNGQVLTESLTLRGSKPTLYDRFVSDASVTIRAEALTAAYRGTASFQIQAADEGLSLDIKLGEKLIIDQQLGQVPVVIDAQVLVDFVVPVGDSYQNILFDAIKIYAKSPLDGALSELTFPVFPVYEDIAVVSEDPLTYSYRFSLYGGGHAIGQDAMGRFSGQFVAKLPVERDFAVNADGLYGPNRIDLVDAEFSVSPKSYSGPTAILVPGKGFTFALWDEVGVSSPIRPDAIVEFRYQVIDDGWVPASASAWKPAVMPFPRNEGRWEWNATLSQGPYFAVRYDCDDLSLDVFGTHRFIGQVRVTDPVTNKVQLYELQPFVTTVKAPACT